MRLAILGALVVAAMFVLDAAERHLWANLILGVMAGTGCILALMREATDFVPEPPVPMPVPATGNASLVAALDQVPIPLLSYRSDTDIQALNRAARTLFRTDDWLTDTPLELAEAIERDDAGAGRVVRLFERAYAVGVSEIQATGQVMRLVSLADVQSEVRMAEATALRDLLRVLSHEIMNSLTPVASLAGIARKHLDGETSPGAQSAREALDFLSQRAQGLARFVEAYRLLARLPDPEPRPVEPGALLNDVVRVFEQSPVARDIVIEMDLPGDIPRLDLDEALFAQALINVLTNAAEACGATEGPHRIGLSVVRNHGEVEIRVGDTGGGIADDLRDKIFHAFVTTKATGTGTGLNLARQIALAHGGDLVLLDKSPPWNTVFGFVFRMSAKDT
jgi:signal transduction histidine kinase